MRERPILFSAPMVRAILEGRKTQTRRVVKWKDLAAGLNLSFTGLAAQRFEGVNGPSWALMSRRGDGCWEERSNLTRCPYGQPGDRLWVRETWADVHPCAIQSGRYSQPGKAGIPGPPPVNYRTTYRADGELLPHWRRADHEPPYFTSVEAEADPFYRKHYGDRGGWTPSIHMPRWASRITLEVTDVRVERLQAISDADVKAEGGRIGSVFGPAADALLFSAVWDDINGDGAWDANPWVWVVSFKQVQP